MGSTSSKHILVVLDIPLFHQEGQRLFLEHAPAVIVSVPKGIIRCKGSTSACQSPAGCQKRRVFLYPRTSQSKSACVQLAFW